MKKSLKEKKVLIIDNREAARKILKEQLLLWGINCQEISSEKEAIKVIEKDRVFHIAIINKKAYDIGGFRLALDLRERFGTEKLHVIILSCPGERIENKNILTGANYLIKPLKYSQLSSLLKKIFTKSILEKKEEKITSSYPEALTDYSLSILLVEDNVINQKVVLRLLDKIGYRADLAANGIEAIQALKRQNYDLILMDIQMPEMDGLEATRNIRKEFPTERQPYIVAMTAGAFSEDKDEAFLAGMNGFLTKPVIRNKLVQAISSCPKKRTLYL